MLGQDELAPIVALVHAPDLRHRHVGFIGKNNGMVGDEFKKRGWRLARRAARQIARIILDPGAAARGLEHFQIEIGALLQPLGFEQFALFDQLVQPLLQLDLDALDGLLHGRARGDVMRIGIDADLSERIGLGPCKRIEFDNGFKLFAEKGKAPGPVFQVGGPQFKSIAPHPE